jgi:nucleotide-binding universal stress UspA family protein
LNRARAARKPRVRARVDVIPGTPADALFALGVDVDLIVLGSGRSSPVSRVSLGKTGSALIDGASFPILVIPRTGDAAPV